MHKTFLLLAQEWLKAHSSVFMSLHAPFKQKEAYLKYFRVFCLKITLPDVRLLKYDE